jgi:hypothetical protein
MEICYIFAGMRLFSVSQLVGRVIYLRRLWPGLYLITPNAGFREKPHTGAGYSGVPLFVAVPPYR